MRRHPSVPKSNAFHSMSSHIPGFTSQQTRALDPCARLQSVPTTNAPQHIPSYVSASAHAQCALYLNNALHSIYFEHVRLRREDSMASRASGQVVGGSSGTIGHARGVGALRSSACPGGKTGFWHRRAWCLRRRSHAARSAIRECPFEGVSAARSYGERTSSW